MSKQYNNGETSRFFCTKCGNEGLPIWRKKGQERKAGHLKKLYCLHCKEEVNHVEIKTAGNYTLDDFNQEFTLGRFLNGDRIPLDKLYLCSKKKCPFNCNGKCWNANNSHHCIHKPIK